MGEGGRLITMRGQSLVLTGITCDLNMDLTTLSTPHVLALPFGQYRDTVNGYLAWGRKPMESIGFTKKVMGLIMDWPTKSSGTVPDGRLGVR
jgi:hypothetical protein